MDSLKKELHILQWHDSIVHKHFYTHLKWMEFEQSNLTSSSYYVNVWIVWVK